MTITINGVDSADDELWGDSGNNMITDTVDIRTCSTSARAATTPPAASAGDDIFYFGAEFTPADSVDGGAGSDDRSSSRATMSTTQLVLGATSLVNVETDHRSSAASPTTSPAMTATSRPARR